MGVNVFVWDANAAKHVPVEPEQRLHEARTLGREQGVARVDVTPARRIHTQNFEKAAVRW
jgi:hypothetical protein